MAAKIILVIALAVAATFLCVACVIFIRDWMGDE